MTPALKTIAAAAIGPGLRAGGHLGAGRRAAAAPLTASQPADPAAVLQGAERIGAGRFTAYRKGASTLVVLPPGSVGKPLLWYTEVVRVPAGAVTADKGLQVSSSAGPLRARGQRHPRARPEHDAEAPRRRRARRGAAAW